MLRFNTVVRFTVASLSGILLFTSVSSAATGDTIPDNEGLGTIYLNQETPDKGILGSWTLTRTGGLPEDKDVKDREDERTILRDMPTGRYTLFIKSPSGAETTVRVTREGEILAAIDRPQVSFNLRDGEEINIMMRYTFTRIGNLAVISTPSGLPFVMTGPNGREFRENTPKSFENFPEGQYIVLFNPIEGCTTPKRKSLRLKAGGRVTFHIEWKCDILERRGIQQKRDENTFVTIQGTEKSNGKLSFRDVMQNMWFAPFIAKVAQLGVMSGYTEGTNETNKSTFGPADLVNAAELAKTAHKIAGINADDVLSFSKNPHARNTWFSAYFASAEERHWLIYRDGKIKPDRSVNRAEVIATLLQALNIPLQWPEGKIFHDVTSTNLYAAAIETAASHGVIEGYKDENGTPTFYFGPADPINRAELAKVLSTMIEMYKENDQVDNGS